MSTKLNIEGRNIPVWKLAPPQERKVSRALFEKLLASIQTFGFVQPLSVYWKDGRYVIVDGILRYMACLKLGIEKAPCLVLPEPMSTASKESNAAVAKKALAYYRQAARDRQCSSISRQRNEARQWAEKHGVKIVKEFSDCGRSGNSTEGRDAFNEMMEQWIKKSNAVEFVIVSSLTRLARDPELLDYIRSEVHRNSKQIIALDLIGAPGFRNHNKEQKNGQAHCP